MLSLLFLYAAAGVAQATEMALEPQNRVHVGLSVVPEPSGFGITGGFDSRLTRLLAIDVGAFASPVPLAEGIAPAGGDRPDFLILRHGLYVMPGIRIPHPQPRAWAWEGFLRAGSGVVWTADTSPEVLYSDGARYLTQPRIAGVAGSDLLARFGRFGVRASGKAWMFEVLDPSPLRSWFTVRSQFGIEALIQW